MVDISSVVVPVPFRPQSCCMDVGVSFRVTAEDTYHSFLETLETVGLCFGGGISECGSVNGSVYRLEDSETGKGPFSSHVSVPFDWSESHRAPMESDSPTYEEYAKWIEKVEPTGWGLPSRYRFAFSTLERLKDCFEGYENYPNFKIMEYIIDTSDPLSCVSLSDGQVIFCEVISKREL